MCRSPTAAAAASVAEVSGRGEDDGEDFSFGTTRPLQLPMVLPPVPSGNVEVLDDEFTFGATMPLSLPDLTHIPKEAVHIEKTPPSSQRDSVASRWSPPKTPQASASDANALRIPGAEYRSVNENYAQVLGGYEHAGWNANAVSQTFTPTPDFKVQSWWPSPPGSISPVSYSCPAASLVFDASVWSKPLPSVMMPMTLPCAACLEPSIQAYPTEGSFADSYIDAGVHVDAGKLYDPEAGQFDDPEAGEDVAANDGPYLNDELASAPWRPTYRRLAAAFCIGILLLCIAALVLLLCADLRGPAVPGK